MTYDPLMGNRNSIARTNGLHSKYNPFLDLGLEHLTEFYYSYRDVRLMIWFDENTLTFTKTKIDPPHKIEQDLLDSFLQHLNDDLRNLPRP